MEGRGCLTIASPHGARDKNTIQNNHMKNIITIIAVLGLSTGFATAGKRGKKAPAPAPTPAPAPAVAPAAAPAEKAGKKGQHKKRDFDKVFARRDTNSDGFIAKDEFTSGAKDPVKAGKAFAKLDDDGNGKVSKAEFIAGREKTGRAKKKKGK